MTPDELQENRRILEVAAVCEAFTKSPMYKLLDEMLEATEHDSMQKLADPFVLDPMKCLALKLAYAERVGIRKWLFAEIDRNINAGRDVIADLGVDPDRVELTGVIDG